MATVYHLKGLCNFIFHILSMCTQQCSDFFNLRIETLDTHTQRNTTNCVCILCGGVVNSVDISRMLYSGTLGPHDVS